MKINTISIKVLFIGLLLSFAVQCCAATTVSIGDITADQGDTVTIPIVIDSIEGYGAGTINLAYNSTVVFVEGATGGSDSTVSGKNINNTAGLVRISAWNPGGVSGTIVFANVTIKAVGNSNDSTTLTLTVDTLQDISYNEIPVDITNGSFMITGQASTIPSSTAPAPFLISGYIYYENGTPCNNPLVNIANLNTGREWTTETNEIFNYYQRILVNGTDLNASEVLQFNVSDGIGYNTTNYAVTQSDINNGGLFEFNLTLPSLSNPPTLVEYTISNRTIAPPQTTDIDVKFSEKVTWKIAIENGGAVYDWTGTSTNPTSKQWNGTYEGNSTIVPDGTYTVNITWTNTTTGLGGQNNTETITVSKPPASITNLQNTTYEQTYINWTWTDPEDADFSKVMVYLDGTFKENVTKGIQFYNATGLTPDTEYEISTHTVGNAGNTNDTWVNHTSRTKPTPDTTAPVINTVILNTTTPNTGDAILVTVDATDDVAVTSVIVGSVEFTSQGGNIWNGTITAIEGTHSVNVSAKDAAEKTGWNNSTSYTATTPDTTAPVITDVANGTPSASSVTITWTTDEASDSVVKYGTVSGDYPYTKSNTAMVTSHSITLTGLDPSTTYYFVVSSTDASDNSAQSAEHNFTTAAWNVAANGSITGKVTDSVTKYTIEGATVTAGGAAVQTNREGDYTISLKAGTYTVSANKAGYVDPTPVSVNVAAGIQATKDFVLVRDYVELELEAGETTTKIGNVNEDISFNLTVTNHGESATYNITNSSTTANILINPITTGLLHDSNTSNIWVKINASITGSYPVTISAITGSKSAAITIVTLALNRSEAGINDSSSVTNNSKLLNGTLVQNNSAVNDSTVTSSIVDNSTVLDANVTDSFLSEDTNVTGGDVTNSTLTNATTTGTNVTGSEIEDSTTSGGTVEGSIVTGSTTTDTTVSGSKLDNVNATGSTITDVTLHNIELTNATVWNTTAGMPTVKGSETTEVTTKGVHFTKVYEDVAVANLVKNQTREQPVPADTPTTTPPDEAREVGASLTLNSSDVGNVTISRCGINPGGSTFALRGFSGNIVGDYIHITHDIPEDAEVNVTIDLYYGTDKPGDDKHITWYNETADPMVWEQLSTTKVEKIDGWYLRVTNLNHLSTFALVTSSAPSDSVSSCGGGGGGTYPLIPASSPAITSAAGTPVEEGAAAETPTPEQVMEFRAEPPSLPPPILSPIAGIVIVAVAAIFGIVMATRAAEDHKKATIGIVIVAVAAIIGMMLM
ncbi:MAG: hypothetical protein EMLJLAPB_00336 [Candidatus Argoarchaeum ethanivorans]|uniref:Fibronectin type-III domain-containing protein n=1 Tax=Candidatus Argoarchaeum ethanivorans TaxID=2608793 RepID=A0A811TAG4_9EURY|nr:MAG: hypothetical protein EMLJLAPB_00336 [Candidatus Argoarchaeum ethanivorans]